MENHEGNLKDVSIPLPSGELTFCHGKIHPFEWENPLFRLGHFPLLFVSSPEGIVADHAGGEFLRFW